MKTKMSSRTKKISKIALIVAAVALLAVFLPLSVTGKKSVNDKPSVVVTKAFNCITKGDYKGYIEYCDIEEDAKSLSVDMLEKTINQIKDNEEAMAKFPKKLRIVEESIQGSEASVVAQLTANDGSSNYAIFKLKKKRGEWKITNDGDMYSESSNLLPSNDEVELVEEEATPAEEALPDFDDSDPNSGRKRR